ncbi:MAG: ABC transporter permease subunit [Pirellulaceae bacterium]
MLVGPVFTREAVVAPRRRRLYVLRTVYAVSLLLLMCTAWMILAGTQIIRNLGDMARFGAILFQILAPLQLVLMMFMSAVQTASGVAVEKDRQTLILLLMTRLSNGELVLGKLFASLLNIGVMLMTALPIFMLIVLFGGTSFSQVGWTFAVTAITALAAGSLGSTLALWREKTFQTLALVALSLVFWIGAAEVIGLWQGTVAGFTGTQIAGALNPLRAIISASSPAVVSLWPTNVVPFLIVMSVVTIALNALAIARVRVWNPSRDVRVGQTGQATEASIFSDSLDGNATASSADDVKEMTRRDESQRMAHVDARVRAANQKSRRVWDNPVLWREACTWAYGKKIVFIRIAYWLLAGFVFYALFSQVQSGTVFSRGSEAAVSIPAAAWILGPFMLLSLVMINALGVTSMTNERDGRSLDLLLVTDLSPREFLFGKLGGVLYVTLDAVLWPIVLCGFLWVSGSLLLEYYAYLVIGWLVLAVFVAMLGLHCGMIYANSRQAIGVSLGTVFFLFLGVVTAMVMMVSFTGSVEWQITPFLACIIGGGVGLYVALGSRNPSSALALASALLPLAMFFSITSLLLGRYLSVLLVMAFTYGFTTTAMIMPALGEFNISMGRVKTIEDE